MSNFERTLERFKAIQDDPSIAPFLRSCNVEWHDARITLLDRLLFKALSDHGEIVHAAGEAGLCPDDAWCREADRALIGGADAVDGKPESDV